MQKLFCQQQKNIKSNFYLCLFCLAQLGLSQVNIVNVSKPNEQPQQLINEEAQQIKKEYESKLDMLQKSFEEEKFNKEKLGKLGQSFKILVLCKMGSFN